MHFINLCFYTCLFLPVKSHHELVRSLKLDQVMKLTEYDYFSSLLVHCISESTAPLVI